MRGNRTALAGWMVCGIALIATTAATGAAYSQEVPTGDRQTAAGAEYLKPVRVGLGPVPVARLDDLEDSVRVQIDSLYAAYRELVANPPSDQDLATTYAILGQIHHAYELWPTAEAAYLNAIRLAPRDFRWVYLLGHVYQQTGRLDEARLYYQRALALKKDDPAVHCRLAQIELESNRPLQAEKLYRQALEIEPDFAAAHSGLGEAALGRKDYSAAVEHFSRALEIVPQAHRLHYLLGMSYRGLGDMERAREHLAQRGLVGVRPADPLLDSLATLIRSERVFTLRARAAYAAGRYQEAAAEFEKAVQADPENAGALINWASALSRLGQNDQAKRQLLKAVELSPKSANAHFNLASLALAAGRRDAAIEHLAKAVEFGPDDLAALALYASLLKASGRAAEALPHAKSLYARSPGENSLIFLAETQVSLLRYAEAMKLIDEAYSRHPESVRTAAALARLLAGVPDAKLRDGARALEIALELYKKKKTVSGGALVAAALAEVGRCQEAAQWQQRMIRVALSSDDATAVGNLQEAWRRYRKGVPCRAPLDSVDGSEEPVRKD